MKHILLFLIVLTSIIVMMDPAFAKGNAKASNKREITFSAGVIFQPIAKHESIPGSDISFPVGDFQCITRTTETSIIGECTKNGATVLAIASCSDSDTYNNMITLRLSDAQPQFTASLYVGCKTK